MAPPLIRLEVVPEPLDDGPFFGGRGVKGKRPTPCLGGGGGVQPGPEETVDHSQLKGRQPPPLPRSTLK